MSTKRSCSAENMLAGELISDKRAHHTTLHTEARCLLSNEKQ